MKRHLSLILILIVSTSCGKKSSSDAADTAATDKLLIEGLAVGQLNLVQKADAATPKGFQTGASLVQPDGSTVCDIYGGSGDSRPGEYWACRAAYEVREAFFQIGPTVIRNRLNSVDDRLNFYIGALG